MDSGWLARLRQGDERAFERLVDLYREPLFRLAYRLVGAADAEDVVQEAFVKIYRALPHFRGNAQLNTWIYRIALNACYEWKRKQKPYSVPLPEGNSETRDPEEEAIQNLIWARVEEAIDQLEERHREVVVLHELQGFTYGEIARLLGVPVGTVKSRLFYAFQELRRLLGTLEEEVLG